MGYMSQNVAALVGPSGPPLIPAVYLPAVSSSPYMVCDLFRMVTGHNTKAATLLRDDAATLDLFFYPENSLDNTTQQIDYTPVPAWIAGHTAVYRDYWDQSGGASATGRKFSSPVGEEADYDSTQNANGYTPALFAGQNAANVTAPKTRSASFTTDATGFNRQGTSIFLVFNPIWCVYNNSWFQISIGGMEFCNIAASGFPGNAGNVRASAFGAPNFSGKLLRTEMETNFVIYGATQVKLMSQGSLQSTATPYPASNSGTTDLTLFKGNAGNGAGSFAGVYVYRTELSTADALAVKAASDTVHTITTAYDGVLVLGDDSVQQAYLTLDLLTMAQQFVGALALNKKLAKFNVGVPGQTLTQAAASASAISAQTFDASKGLYNFWIIQGKINDFPSSTDIAIWQKQIDYTNTLRNVGGGANTGWTVIWDAGTPVGGAAGVPQKTDLFNMAQWATGRNSISSNLGATNLFSAQPTIPQLMPDLVAPVYFDSILGGPTLAIATAQTANTSIYVDTTHPTALGQNERASVCAPVINAGLAAIAAPTYGAYGASIFVNTPTATLTAASLAALGTITTSDLLLFHLVNANANVFQAAGPLSLGGNANGERAPASIQNPGATTEQFFWKQPTLAEIAVGNFSCTFLSGTGAGVGGFYVHLIKNANRASIQRFTSSAAGLTTLDFAGFIAPNLQRGIILLYDVDQATSPGITQPSGFTLNNSINGTTTRTYAISSMFGPYVNNTNLSISGLPGVIKRGWAIAIT